MNLVYAASCREFNTDSLLLMLLYNEAIIKNSIKEFIKPLEQSLSCSAQYERNISSTVMAFSCQDQNERRQRPEVHVLYFNSQKETCANG